MLYGPDHLCHPWMLRIKTGTHKHCRKSPIIMDHTEPYIGLWVYLILFTFNKCSQYCLIIMHKFISSSILNPTSPHNQFIYASVFHAIYYPAIYSTILSCLPSPHPFHLQLEQHHQHMSAISVIIYSHLKDSDLFPQYSHSHFP